VDVLRSDFQNQSNKFKDLGQNPFFYHQTVLWAASGGFVAAPMPRLPPVTSTIPSALIAVISGWFKLDAGPRMRRSIV
jgi:hypothetical protein